MHVAQENWKATCLVCKKEIQYGEWKCDKLPGSHKVQEKTYFHLGGSHLQNWRERRGWSPQVILRAGYGITDPRTGAQTLEPTVRVYFSNQQLTTEDPQIQFLVETKNDMTIAWGEEGHKSWQKIYLTQDQQKDLANSELENLNKQIRESNALLAEVQGRGKTKLVEARS
jgi:ABC-type Fe3+-citrate transport system substrate-binding protein